jgi:hypothetical protein
MGSRRVAGKGWDLVYWMSWRGKTRKGKERQGWSTFQGKEVHNRLHMRSCMHAWRTQLQSCMHACTPPRPRTFAACAATSDPSVGGMLECPPLEEMTTSTVR